MSQRSDNQADKPATKPPAARRKSTGFPVVPLAEAASILKDAGKFGFEHSTAAFASYMGHSTTNSGAFRQRLSAFRDWKLITGRGEHLTMTEAGKMIALPTDEEAELRALRDSFHSFAPFSRLYEGSAKGTPLPPRGLQSRAVHEFGVAPNRASKFVDSFIESAITSGLGSVAENGQVTLLAPEDDPAGSITPEPTFGGGLAHRTSMPRPGAPVVHQSWTIASGRIIFEIRSDQPLPASAFVTVGEVVASLENLARTLGPEERGADTDDDEGLE